MATDWSRVDRVTRIARRTLLWGPPGTGKSTAAMTTDGKETYPVSLHDETTVAELVGHFLPVGHRFVWMDGPAMAAWRTGGRLVLDELDLASGPVLSICRGILNDPAVAALSIPNASLAGMSDEEVARMILAGEGLEKVRPHADFQVVATMNGRPEDLDDPLRERFDATFHIDEPHPNALKALPRELRATAKRTAMERNDARRISVRRWLSFCALGYEVGQDDAAVAVFGDRAMDVLAGLSLGDLFGGDGKKPQKSKGDPPTVADVIPPTKTETAPSYLDVENEAVRSRCYALDELSRVELREMAKRLDLKQQGFKSELVIRIAEAEAAVEVVA